MGFPASASLATPGGWRSSRRWHQIRGSAPARRSARRRSRLWTMRAAVATCRWLPSCVRCWQVAAPCAPPSSPSPWCWCLTVTLDGVTASLDAMTTAVRRGHRDVVRYVCLRSWRWSCVVVFGRVYFWPACGCLRAAELLTCACVATLLFGPSPCAPQVCRQVWRRVAGHSVAVAQAHLRVHAASRSERRRARGLRGVPRRDRGLCALGDDVAPAVQRLVAAPAAQPGAAHPRRGPPQVTHKSRGWRSPVFRCVAGHTAAAPAAAPACTWYPVCQLLCPQPRTSGCGWEWEWEWEWEC